VVLDDVAALIHGIGALAESEEALPGLGLPAKAESPDTGTRPGGEACRERDHALGVAREHDLEAAAERIRRFDLRTERVTGLRRRHCSRRVRPARRRAEPEWTGGPRREVSGLGEDG